MFGEEGSWIISQDDEVVSGESDGLELDSVGDDAQEVETSWRETFVNRIKGSRRFLLGLAFLAGLILGWIVIGRWLWPANRNADPWDLRRQHRANYVGLVAEDYWYTRDVFRAKESLAGWDEDELTDLMAEMASQASSSEERQRLMALAKALQLPDYQMSLLTSFLIHKGILLSFLLSASPLIVAIALAVSPLVGRVSRGEPTAEVDELLDLEDPELLEEMLRQRGIGPDGEYIEGGGDGTGEHGGETEKYGEGTGEPGEEEEDSAKGEDEEDWDEWDDEDDEEKDEAEKEGAVADILMDLFDEDDESFASLRALAQDLPEVDIDDLLLIAQKITQRFRTEVRRAA